ncbi:hypothetical protein EVAR_19707_1 [Eumeta japonica]|uniref:Uncharacterized protein n=1 Tax=Eumeta variegata TaxID=151549 RepID=A0A4C1URR5_EUMVA|nr:hypothetical protein EVAR_19707_1 [Eumeta japonica]
MKIQSNIGEEIQDKQNVGNNDKNNYLISPANIVRSGHIATINADELNYLWGGIPHGDQNRGRDQDRLHETWVLINIQLLRIDVISAVCYSNARLMMMFQEKIRLD